MLPWIFYDFLDSRGNNEIRAWLDGLPEKAAAKIDVRILIMMRGVSVWPAQYVSSLKGWPELVELRIVFGGNQYRPIGFYGPNRGEFTMVLGTIEKGKLPRRILDVADSNRKLVIADPKRICEELLSKVVFWQLIQAAA